MAMPDIPEDLLRLAEGLVFASAEPATWSTLASLLPPDLGPDQVFQALQAHCAGRGVILCRARRRLCRSPPIMQLPR